MKLSARLNLPIMKIVIFSTITLLCLVGCGEPEILHYKVPKEKRARTPVSQSAIPASSSGAKASSHNGISWTLPKDWTFEAGSGMRFGTIKFHIDETPVECTLVKLGGAAGGLAPNVNRWRDQIGLSPANAAEIEKSLETIEGKSGPVKVSTLINPDNADQAILASIINAKNSTLFVKIMTQSALINRAKADFTSFSASLQILE